MARTLIAGALLGVLSRIEEVTEGFSVAISSNATWLAVAVLAATPLRGALALTAANAAYYGWVALTETTPLAAAAGPPGHWFALGVAGGAVAGAIGLASGHRAAAAAVMWAAVSVADAFGIFGFLLP